MGCGRGRWAGALGGGAGPRRWAEGCSVPDGADRRGRDTEKNQSTADTYTLHAPAMIAPEERVRLTKERFPTLGLLRGAVLSGEYSSDSPFFSRSFLWRSVCHNSYNLGFREDELKPVPEPGEEEDITEIRHSKEQLTREGTAADPLQNDDSIMDVIRLDADRLLIDPIFQQQHIKQDIVQIMYNYDKFTPYKQGFHEICGMVYLQLYQDDPNNDKIKIQTFNIFTAMMMSVVPNFYNSDHLILWCVGVFNKYLRLVDPPLYDLMIKTHRIESQVWLIRWVRLLFLREIGTENTVKLWDLMLCHDHDFSALVPFLIILFLLKLKLRLVECEDNGEVLSLLLHYPHASLSCEEAKQLVDWSITLSKAPEDQLHSLGIMLNRKIHKGFKWEKIKDLDRIRLELRLKRRVSRALKK